ncbi:HalOD1 output domain-containing protein [Haloarcula litorea]|uniref:HalOD1 output domain-containing protein n=1 Tax=Haloarcula litorea TaxID=3032579 RepID=UPI0023E86FB9|nr:HalOD1 output domain-containing protein [Halomicroarcula sp. GDY20]
MACDDDAQSDGRDSGRSETDDAAVPTYHPETDTYIEQFDPDTVAASRAVVESIAAVRRRSPMEADPLYETIDPDALDSVVESGDPSVSVTFDVDGFWIEVRAIGRIEITPPE